MTTPSIKPARLLLALSSLLLYALIFPVLYPYAHQATAALNIVPAAVFGWLLGPRGGLLYGMLAVPSNMFLFRWVGNIEASGLVPHLMATSVMALGSAGIGWIRGLTYRATQQADELRVERLLLHEEIKRRLQAEARLIEAQRIARVGNFVFDLSSGDVLSASDECYHLFGMDPVGGAVAFETFLARVHPDDRDRVRSIINAFLKDHRPFSTEYRIVHPGGAEKIVHAHAGVGVGGPEVPVQGTGTLQDVTDQRRIEAERIELERRLLRAQKLQSLGIMAGGIAHDFNNLLMAITGNIEMAQMKLPSATQARAHLGQAVLASQRAAELINHLLTYTGKNPAQFTAVDLSALVRESFGLLHTAAAKNASIDLRLSSDVGPAAGNAGQIQQVIMNLITNASEAIGDQNGDIIVSTDERYCDQECLSNSRLDKKPTAGRFVFLEVTDTGCGMDEETVRRLFDPFFTTKFTGRGLGMSAVAGIVYAHNGAIFVESEKRKGTAISVLFPSGGTGPVGIDPARENLIVRSNQDVCSGSILLAEDELAVREVCTAMLQSFGFNVITAADGEEALRLFGAHAGELDCVILDLTMPRMNGMGALRAMRALRPDVPVIISSGYDEQETMRNCNDACPAGFLHKPYSPQKLRDLISGVLQGRGNCKN